MAVVDMASAKGAICVVMAPLDLGHISCGHSNISPANDFAGSPAGSQRHQAPAGSRLRAAAVVAGSRQATRRRALSGDGPALYGMQKVRGSNPLSFTFSQLKGML